MPSSPAAASIVRWRCICSNTKMPPADKTPATDKPELIVRIYNRFDSRELHHGTFKSLPQQFAEVPKSVADNWKRLFPDHIVDAGVAQKEIGGLQAQLSEKEARIAELEKQLAALSSQKGGSPSKGDKSAPKPDDQV